MSTVNKVLRKGRVNSVLFVAIISLILMGAIIIFSASAVISQENFGNSTHYAMEHLLALLGGGLLMFFGYKVDYKFWKKIAPFLLIAGITLLLLIFVPGLGQEYNGARRWVSIFGITFAPVEAYKLFLIIFLASWLSGKKEDITSFYKTILPFLLIMSVTAVLIMMQPDLGTLITIAMIAAVMLFVSGARISHLILLGSLGLTGAIYFIKNEAYRLNRFMIFLNPSADQSNLGYQINQALLAIGTGGLFGLGFGQSRQKFSYLPEASSDSIFAIAAEELGLLRVSIILILFGIVAYQGFKVARKAPDNFSKFLAVGITSWITFQAIVNIFAILSLIPLTGIPLPFISKGSSSTIILMLASGILLNISKHTGGKTRESRLRRRRDWRSYFANFGRS